MHTLPPESLLPDTIWRDGKMEQQPRELPEQRERKQYKVLVIHRRTQSEAGWYVIRADGLKDAEEQAVAKAALDKRENPAELEARHVHELCPACGQIVRGGAE